jgi:hypothetical protein
MFSFFTPNVNIKQKFLIGRLGMGKNGKLAVGQLVLVLM